MSHALVDLGVRPLVAPASAVRRQHSLVDQWKVALQGMAAHIAFHAVEVCPVLHGLR